MLIDMSMILRKARAERYGVIGPCPMNAEQVKCCFEAAQNMKAPVIICSHGSLKTSMAIEDIADVAHFYAKRFPEVPAALCLDHGTGYEAAVRAIRAGFTGVMVDCSMDPLEHNIQVVKEVVPMAHAAGVGVEAAVGGVPWRDATPEEIEAYLTNVQDFKRFVEETNVDAVAVAVGSSHGDNKKEVCIRYDLIAALREAAPAAMVMHGCSESGDEHIRKAATTGIAKLNIGGDLVAAGVRNVRAYMNQNPEHTYPDMLDAICAGYRAQLEHFMEITNSKNRA